MGNLLEQNPIVTWIGKRSKLLKMIMFVLSFMFAIGLFVFARSEDGMIAKCALVLFLIIGYFIWCILIESFCPKTLQSKAAAFALILFFVVMIAGLVAEPFQVYEKVLICSEINPDGVQIAEGYKIQNEGEEQFAVEVYIKGTSRNTRGQYVSYLVYQNDAVSDLELSWKSNRVLLINGEEFRADYHYLS